MISEIIEDSFAKTPRLTGIDFLRSVMDRWISIRRPWADRAERRRWDAGDGVRRRRVRRRGPDAAVRAWMRLGFGAGESLRHGECICGLSKAIQGSERSMRRREAEQKLRRAIPARKRGRKRGEGPYEIAHVDTKLRRRSSASIAWRNGETAAAPSSAGAPMAAAAACARVLRERRLRLRVEWVQGVRATPRLRRRGRVV